VSHCAPPFQVESGDLIAYGLIPEFIGRFPILVSLAALNEDQLVQVSLVSSVVSFLESCSEVVVFPYVEKYVICQYDFLSTLSPRTNATLSFQVLMEPKNALGKQFKKLFSMNNVSIFVMKHAECNIFLASQLSLAQHCISG
jgi:ATP-dependent Clp protease ATP-binding subunit ClpX